MDKDRVALLYNAIAKRHSVRNYYTVKVGEEKATQLKQVIDSITPLQGHKVFVDHINEEGGLESLFRVLSYAPIKGVRHALLLSTDQPGRDADYEVGYQGEQLVLALTALGLGSCWMAVYRTRLISKYHQLEPSNCPRVFIVYGCPTPNGKGLWGKLAKLINREKDLEEISTSSLTEWEGWQLNALRAVQTAPSSINSQPWLFSRQKELIRLEMAGKARGSTCIDLGIAMLHFELGAAVAGVEGKWQQTKKGWVFVKKTFV